MTEETRCNLCGERVVVPDAVRWHKDGFDVVQCPGCGLLFRAKLPAETELEEIYGADYFVDRSAHGGQGYAHYLADEEVHRLVARRRLDLLERFGARDPLLDVGAAAGFFLDEARARGWRVRGADVSDAMAGEARRLGLDVVTGRFDQLEAEPGEFGTVTMWDYIEHTLDPVRELRRARALLSGSGVLALSTGDSATAVARLSGSRWHLLTPRHHNYFFTGRTLQQTLHRAGFRILWTGHPGARYTLRYLVHKLRTAAPRSRALAQADERVAPSRIGRVTVPVNLRDIITVVAQPGEEAPG